MRRPLALGAAAFAVVLLVGAGVLGLRAYQDWQNLQQPLPTRLGDTSRIQPWMTVRFIANSHRAQVSALATQLGAPVGGNVTLTQLARMRGVPVPQVVEDARQAVATLRSATPAAGPAAAAKPP
jgi:hypothetical protein